MPHIHVSHFVLTSLSDALVTFVSDQVTTNVKHRVRTTGSEHQGQNSISDPDQNLGYSCIFSSGMQEHMSQDLRKPTFLFLTWSDTNQAVQLQKMAKGFKFRI